MTINITNKPLELTEKQLQNHYEEYRKIYPISGQEKESFYKFVRRKISAVNESYGNQQLLLG